MCPDVTTGAGIAIFDCMTLTKDEFTSIVREYYPDIEIEEFADGLIIRPNLLMDVMVIG